VVAGGSGRRFGGRKQFLELAGRPVASWSVAAARPASDGVVLVVPEGDRGPGVPGPGAEPDDCGADRVVTGGVARADSVRAGLAAVPDEAEVIVVHDAARPLAPPSLFAAVIDAVRTGGAVCAIPVLPVTDTLKRTSGGLVTSTVDRDGLVSVQTPQAFAADVLRRAHGSGGVTTDDAGLVEQLGLPVRSVPGDPRNLKITRPDDLDLAGTLLAGVER
jgi:2-C-methyl-D-erythritol 4-phosphate cytidylyltransferase